MIAPIVLHLNNICDSHLMQSKHNVIEIILFLGQPKQNKT